MVPLYRVIGEKCNFCTYIVTGARNGPLYMLTSKKCNFCSYILKLVLQMVPLYMLTGKKCNFCTYFVIGAPNGPPIHGDWGKVQFLHLHCQWCSKWSPYIG